MLYILPMKLQLSKQINPGDVNVIKPEFRGDDGHQPVRLYTVLQSWFFLFMALGKNIKIKQSTETLLCRYTGSTRNRVIFWKLKGFSHVLFLGWLLDNVCFNMFLAFGSVGIENGKGKWTQNLCLYLQYLKENWIDMFLCRN